MMNGWISVNMDHVGCKMEGLRKLLLMKSTNLIQNVTDYYVIPSCQIMFIS
jgi:hypothetical protein